MAYTATEKDDNKYDRNNNKRANMTDNNFKTGKGFQNKQKSEVEWSEVGLNGVGWGRVRWI